MRFPFSFCRRLRRRRWGELTAYSFILLASLTFFLIQFTTWAVPQVAQLQEFVPARAIVKETRVFSKTVDGSTVYRPEVLIDYGVKGTSYERWAFSRKTLDEKNGFVPKRETAEAAILPFTIGKEIDCWFNAEHPEQVVVSWDIPIWGWFFLFLSLCLTVLGIVGTIRSLRHNVVSDERKAAEYSSPKPLFFSESVRFSDQPTVPDIRSIGESPGTHLAFRLPLGTQPLFPLIGLTIFGIAWNVVAGGVMLHSFWNPVNDWSDRVFGSVLRGIFWGVGLLLLAAAFHRILLTFGIGPTVLEVSDHPVYPGRRYRLRLMQSGVLRFRELTVSVVCEEIARFHQGTDTITSRKEVFRQALFSRSDFETAAGTPLEHEFFLQLPLGAMHSFRQENNEILWKINVFANLVGWPDIHRDCPIIVQPPYGNDTVSEGSGIFYPGRTE